MPLNFPSSPTNGQIYTDDNSAVWQFDGVAWNVITGTTKRLFNGVQVGISSSFYLTSTSTGISWDIENFDTGNYWSVSQPTRITVGSTGYYNLTCTFFTPNVGAGYEFVIKKNSTTTVTSTNINANQSAVYDETNFFSAGDYIEILASETTNTGYLSVDTVVQLTLLGLALGTGINSNSAFSGARTELTSAFNTTSTLTPLDWDVTVFDTNANALALQYWSALTPSRLTVLNNGFYQVSGVIETQSGLGGQFTVSLRKNGSTTITTATINSNDSVNIDRIYQLSANDYLEILVSDTLASGQITTESFLEIQRLGLSS